MPVSRFQPPDQLSGATAFSSDASVRGSLNMVELLKSQPWVWSELRDACNLSQNWGRVRQPGDWVLAMVAFVVSGHIDIQPWHDQTTDDLWEACGFDSKPNYHTVRRRLRELEGCEKAFITTIARLVQRARENDPRVGAHVHVDGTEDETHAALIHDCQPGEDCPYREVQQERRARRARRPGRVSTHVARRDRQNENTRPTDEAEAASNGTVEIVERAGKLIKRIRQSDCWYRTSDLEAGIRAYTGDRGARRFWHGYYNQKVIDHFTGGVLYSGTYNASVLEHSQLPDLYEKATRIIGEAPQTLIADKGHSVSAVFEMLTSGGTAPIIPWRANGTNVTRHDEVAYDRHGVPRCRHCGGTTTFVRFTGGGSPRISFKCLLPATDDCAREQSINCSTDWRTLVPLWRTDPLYQELRHSMGSFEAQHDYWRDRYRVGADTLANRPKIISMGWHKLRGLVAGVVEWLRICHREGWLSSPRRNTHHPLRRARQIGIRNAERLMQSRVRNGLMAAYGPAAEALSLGSADPPSRRPPGQA